MQNSGLCYLFLLFINTYLFTFVINKKVTMINTEGFIERLNQIIDYYELSASALSERIDVQRSGISHIISGRNKPSLDFVLKLLKEFPEIDLDWLIYGQGSFPKQTKSVLKSSPDLFTPQELEETSVKQTNKPLKNVPEITTNSLEIEQIVIFYKNGNFKYYTP